MSWHWVRCLPTENSWCSKALHSFPLLEFQLRSGKGRGCRKARWWMVPMENLLQAVSELPGVGPPLYQHACATRVYDSYRRLCIPSSPLAQSWRFLQQLERCTLPQTVLWYYSEPALNFCLSEQSPNSLLSHRPWEHLPGLSPAPTGAQPDPPSLWMPSPPHAVVESHKSGASQSVCSLCKGRHVLPSAGWKVLRGLVTMHFVSSLWIYFLPPQSYY